MAILHIAQYIREFYPEYYGYSSYPADQCCVVNKLQEEWGIFSNFFRCPLSYEGVEFKSTEQLFQLMKFQDPEAIIAVYKAKNPKMTAKHWQATLDKTRKDWGAMLVDAMKFCMALKYEQCEAFRSKLNMTKGRYIVELQANPKKKADAWNTRLEGSNYVGPNLLGRLLMELRDNEGHFDYHLPDDAFDFITILKENKG